HVALTHYVASTNRVAPPEPFLGTRDSAGRGAGFLVKGSSDCNARRFIQHVQSYGGSPEGQDRSGPYRNGHGSSTQVAGRGFSRGNSSRQEVAKNDHEQRGADCWNEPPVGQFAFAEDLVASRCTNTPAALRDLDLVEAET